MKIKLKKIRVLVINRTKWARDGLGGASALLNEEGNMCCLGFYEKACGVPDDLLKYKDYPSGALGVDGCQAWLTSTTKESLYTDRVMRRKSLRRRTMMLAD